ncbi:MAG TPA: malto-oligosyltrehalose synthase [Acidimicrobiales bacterium]|nr:malto-oligosyltrehalose synthase [Acidimicrobiales bacterium]
MNPRSTYRVQLHATFGFADAAAVVPYLSQLGVSHLYCSPYFAAVPGSMHGYDVVDPQELNPELGGPQAFAGLVEALRAEGMGQVLDIVPNHMAADPAANAWWWDVLEYGPSSPFARFFDIEWEAGDFAVLVPILGDHYGRALEAKELHVTRDGRGFVLHYYDHELPLNVATMDGLITRAARSSGSAPLRALGESLGALDPGPSPGPARHTAERHGTLTGLKAELGALCESEPAVCQAVDQEVEALNRDIDELDQLLRRQNFRVAFWRTASEELDYRRFFNIDTLVGVRVEDPLVFTETHRLALELVDDGTLDGLRVDHVDGLSAPGRYLDDLARAARGAWLVVEKILEPDERLADWPVAGTTGYDFLVRVNNLFVATECEAPMTALYADFSGERASYPEIVHQAKLQIMRDELAVEVDRVVALLMRICDRHRRQRDHTRRELVATVRELVAHLTVYRTYVDAGKTASGEDRRRLRRMASAARECCPELDGELMSFVVDLAVRNARDALETEFLARFQQLSSAVMAKGVEDTAFYRYHRLISLNEVGGDPGVFGRSVVAFHNETAASAARWPDSMLTLSTHDTKRSADVRARLNVLSEMPDAWGSAVGAWAGHNERHRGAGWPEPNVEYLLYQTLVGAWPLEADRAVGFLHKATREAKVHTSWTAPSADYENALEYFVRAVLADVEFLAMVEAFLVRHRIIERGWGNSMAQMALLLTCPGVPDLYQGSELWDLSLVDPDNRRPVDYERRRRALEAVRGATAQSVLECWESGLPKLWLTLELLEDRRRHPGRYAGTHYEPLAVSNAGPDDVIAFTRGDLGVVVPCRTHGAWWSEAAVELPHGGWRNLLTGMHIGSTRGPVRDVLGGFPVAVLEREAS